MSSFNAAVNLWSKAPFTDTHSVQNKAGLGAEAEVDDGGAINDIVVAELVAIAPVTGDIMVVVEVVLMECLVEFANSKVSSKGD